MINAAQDLELERMINEAKKQTQQYYEMRSIKEPMDTQIQKSAPTSVEENPPESYPNTGGHAERRVFRMPPAETYLTAPRKKYRTTLERLEAREKEERRQCDEYRARQEQERQKRRIQQAIPMHPQKSPSPYATNGGNKSTNNINRNRNFLDIIDPETVLLVALIWLLYQDNADWKLLLALVYILIV